MLIVSYKKSTSKLCEKKNQKTKNLNKKTPLLPLTLIVTSAQRHRAILLGLVITRSLQASKILQGLRADVWVCVDGFCIIGPITVFEGSVGEIMELRMGGEESLAGCGGATFLI